MRTLPLARRLWHRCAPSCAGCSASSWPACCCWSGAWRSMTRGAHASAASCTCCWLATLAQVTGVHLSTAPGSVHPGTPAGMPLMPHGHCPSATRLLFSPQTQLPCPALRQVAVHELRGEAGAEVGCDFWPGLLGGGANCCSREGGVQLDAGGRGSGAGRRRGGVHRRVWRCVKGG